MATAFHVEIVTPEKILFSGEADEVSMRTDGGEIAFLARHEDYIAAVDITVVTVSTLGVDPSDAEGHALSVACHGGFVHVRWGGVTILAGVAELAGEIDVERARRALVAAEERLVSEGPPTVGRHGEAEDAEAPQADLLSGAMVALLAPESAEAAVRRAKVRLAVAGAAATTT